MNQWKECSQSVPHFPTDEQKQVHLVRTKDYVETTDGDPNFFKAIVIGDKSRRYIYNSQIKQQSAAWLSLGVSEPTNIKQQKSKVKILLITFFDAKALLNHKFIPPGQTVTSTVYLAVMKCLMHHIRRILLEYHKLVSWSLLYDNVPTHTTTLLIRYYAKNQITVLFHPPTHQIWLRLTFFVSQNQVEDERQVFRGYSGQPKPLHYGVEGNPSEFSRASGELYERCHECICREGFYVEGWCE